MIPNFIEQHTCSLWPWGK